MIKTKMENSPFNHKNKENSDKSSIKFENSIDFLNKVEKIYLYPEDDDNVNNLFKLNNYKNNNKKESIKVINSIPKTSLNSLIFKKGIIITAIAVKINSIYIGTNKGEIRSYSWKTEKKLNFYISPEISREIKKDVICMDVTDDNKALVVGYLNGYIILWDVDTSNCKKIINEEFFAQITAIKFTLNDKSFYEFLASDIKGSVKRVSVSEGFFYNSINSSNVIEYNKAITVIEVLKLTKEQKNIVRKYNKRDDQEDLLVVAFGSTDKVFILQIEPEIKNLYTFNKPQYIPYSFFPDICFNQGRIPAPFIYDKDFSEDINKHINIKKELNIKFNSNLNLNEEYQLIYISWGKILHVFILSFDLNDFLSISQIGYYINNEPIIRMGFLSNNIIYLMNIYKKFKIINTAFVNSGEIEFDSHGTIINKNLYESELCPEFSLDYTILFQSYLNENDSDSIYKSSYNNLVLTHDKSFFIACKKYIYIGMLLNWEQCVNELFKNSNKFDSFKLCINIYHGNNKILDGIPIKMKERKDNVKRLLKGLILQLILNTLNVKEVFFGLEKSKEILTKCLYMAIELCLDVGEINFLFKDILRIMEEKGYFDFFMEKIKPFILKNKISSVQLGQNLTLKMLKYYMNKNDYGTMSRIIINIDDDKFDIEEIKNACWDNNLIIPLVYIYFKYYEENIFSLIVKLYDLFHKSNNSPKNEFEEFRDAIISKKIENIDETLKTRQYLGQKLFWLINLTLNGKKYPKEAIIKKDVFENLIQNLFLWITKDEILTELLSFDSYTFFIIYSNFYDDDKLLSIIKKIGKETKLYEECTFDSNYLEKFDIKNIIQIILNKVNSIKNILIEDDLNEFILKINTREQISPIDCIINSIKYILNFKDSQSIRENTFDYFEYHTIILNYEKIELYSLLINSVIDISKEKIGKDTLKQILFIAEKNDFPLVVIKIYEILKENIKCIDIFLSNNTLKDKENKLFIFIDDFMSKSDNSELKRYKNELLNRIDKLADIDIEKLLNISLKWMNNEQLKIIDKIAMKDGKKLNYIEKYLNFYNNNDTSFLNEEKSKKLIDKDYNKILITYIDILCRLNKKEDIIHLIKEDSAYVNNDILKICLKYNISEAAIYIYIKQEQYLNALDLCKEEINKILDKLIQIFLDKDSKNRIDILNKYNNLINDIFLICEKENKQKIWFDVFDFLFNKLGKINSKEEKEKINLNEIKLKISNDINNFILRMHSHINIKIFIEEIYKKPHMTEIKNFNNILSNYIKEQIALKKIYEDTISIIDYTISDNFKLKYKLMNEVKIYIINECNYCHKIFQESDEFILFNCGHICHKNNECCMNNKECKICFIEKGKVSIGSLDEKKDKLILNNEEKNIDNKLNTIEDSKNKKEEKFNIKNIYKKLNNIDEIFMKRKSFMDIKEDKI